MSRSRPSPADADASERSRLRDLASMLGAALDVEPGEPATVVRVCDLGAEVELGFLTLEEGDHPLAFLVGFEAPADWAAIGVVCTGRARHLDDRDGSPVAVRVAQVVARSGAWASSWTPLGPLGTGPAAAAFGDPDANVAAGGAPEAPTGRVDDALRRALGLATPPPPAPEGSALLWATQWLDELVIDAVAGADGRDARRRRPLATLVAAHPAVAAFDLDPARTTLPELVAAGHRLTALRTWPQMREACAGGRWHHDEVEPATAAWLDDGAFARWLLGAYPDLADLRATLGALLAPSALDVVDDALAGWGLLPGSEVPE